MCLHITVTDHICYLFAHSALPVQLSFAVVVYPSLLLTYLGQTSMIVSR